MRLTRTHRDLDRSKSQAEKYLSFGKLPTMPLPGPASESPDDCESAPHDPRRSVRRSVVDPRSRDWSSHRPPALRLLVGGRSEPVRMEISQPAIGGTGARLAPTLAHR